MPGIGTGSSGTGIARASSAASTTPKKLGQTTEVTTSEFTEDVMGKHIPVVIGTGPVPGVVVYGAQVIIETIYSGDYDAGDDTDGPGDGTDGGGGDGGSDPGAPSAPEYVAISMVLGHSGGLDNDGLVETEDVGPDPGPGESPHWSTGISFGYYRDGTSWDGGPATNSWKYNTDDTWSNTTLEYSGFPEPAALALSFAQETIGFRTTADIPAYARYAAQPPGNTGVVTPGSGAEFTTGQPTVEVLGRSSVAGPFPRRFSPGGLGGDPTYAIYMQYSDSYTLHTSFPLPLTDAIAYLGRWAYRPSAYAVVLQDGTFPVYGGLDHMGWPEIVTGQELQRLYLLCARSPEDDL